MMLVFSQRPLQALLPISSNKNKDNYKGRIVEHRCFDEINKDISKISQSS